MNNQELLWALEFAMDAHAGQEDLQGKPYIFHPIRVGLSLLAAGCSNVIVAAGFNHDAVEDTVFHNEPITLDDIEVELGSEVRRIVDAMTRRGHLKGKEWVWDETYKVYIRRCCADLEGRIVKEHDVRDNLDRRRRTPKVPVGRYYWTLEYLESLKQAETKAKD